MAPEVWISVTCTDRSGPLGRLVDELCDQSERLGLRPRFFIVENSTQTAEQEATRNLCRALVDRGFSIVIEPSEKPGSSIAASRLRQREQIRRALPGQRPEFVWMLDDDVRLCHLGWNGNYIEEKPLHEHLAFLLEFRRKHAAVEVLVGEVTKDSPIPVVGSMVSRLLDLEVNLRRMFQCEPEALWRPTPATIERLEQPDAYYDFSLEASPTSMEQGVDWLPRGGMLSTEEALRQMLHEVEHISLGACFSRPLLAAPERFERLFEHPRRGANAVFFAPERCLEHEYPSMNFGELVSRRSDMIGLMLLSVRGATVRGSGFSVMHDRPRSGPWPDAAQLAGSLVADTLGATLSREISGHISGDSCEDFLPRRLERVRAASRTLFRIAGSLRMLARQRPRWACSLDPALAVLDWACACFPCSPEGIFSPKIEDVLLAPATSARIAQVASRLMKGEPA
jgi:hypothetical protein